ncbi:MAG: hypothetical protein OJF50_006582 [Nitrospira sp.]|jgi:hypothetical protein|nr:hypothetical protein [Nitrospira sp.]
MSWRTILLRTGIHTARPAMGPWSFQKSRMSEIDCILFWKSTRFLPWAVMTVAWNSRHIASPLVKCSQKIM